jgi:DNA (cytosine-5)-methyltransferase 1
MSPIPVIDLFAGPGGLGEGFSSVVDSRKRKAFEIKVSIEKDEVAHKTLMLRSLFRHISSQQALKLYLEFMRGELPYSDFISDRLVADAAKMAAQEARCAELGKVSPKKVDSWIRKGIAGRADWVLIGGPPCQAYSLAGRSRRTNDAAFEHDEKHFLYREYLRIIKEFSPAVFVMENVKGILSSEHAGKLIFTRIVNELSHPKSDLDYEIRSFVCHSESIEPLPGDFIVRSELYGIPQMRHRVILLGVRRDYSNRPHRLLHRLKTEVTAGKILAGLPRLRSRISKKGLDSFEQWHSALAESPSKLQGWRNGARRGIEAVMQKAIAKASQFKNADSLVSRGSYGIGKDVPRALITWINANSPQVPCQHEARGHMKSDLWRYIFVASYASVTGRSPKLRDFPDPLLPAHANARAKDAPNTDRFRVQVKNRPSSTIVSHIAKDGHYYIHPDPSQCRSLTVREAARLQTFPDNYFFMGGRTQQYAQVGNAVPPYLAKQLGKIVLDILHSAK